MDLECRIRVLALGLTCAGAVACTEWAPASDSLPEVNETMLQGATGDTLGADWSCLDSEPEPATAPTPSAASVIYSLALVDLATTAPVTDATVRACGLTDITCAAPASNVITPDDQGWISVPLASNFRGYLEITSPRMVPLIVPLPDGPLRTMRDYPMVLISPESYIALVTALQIQADPTSGGVAARAFDCQGNTAAGVTFSSNTSGVAWYFENGLPNRTRQQTDKDGLGGFAGTSPGVALLGASLLDGTPVSSRSVFIRGGWITAAYLRPAAAPDF